MYFEKGQALGNDYFVIDAAAHPEITTDEVVRLCDRHRGAGSDGVLYADLTASPYHLRIINPDGTEAEKSGNGLRIFGAWLYHHGHVPLNDWFRVRLVKDTVSMRVEQELDEGGVLVRVEMGGATFRGADVAFTPQSDEVAGYELELPRGGSAAISTVSLGNPHCVVFLDELVREDFVLRAPQLCTHRAFTHGTNVQFARVIGPRELEAWIWERGAGETMASGSSACAVAAAAVRRGFVQPGQFIVQMEGGTVEVGISPDYAVELLGPASMVYSGNMMDGRTGAGAGA